MDPDEKLKIKYSDWGIANNMGDYILLNRNLKLSRYDLLRERLIKHELEHTPGGTKIKDVLIEMKDPGIDMDLIWFIIENPKALAQLSPVWIYDKKIYYDIPSIAQYSLIGLMTIIAYLIIKWIA